MNELTAVIIDDEALSRDRLRSLLAAHSTLIQVIDEASDGQEGVTKVNRSKPDVIFLDVRMPLLNGFELLKRLEYNPRVVFTTAYEEYAVKAFELNSIDYLLKPFRADRLEITIDKLKTERIQSISSKSLDELLLQLRKKSIAHSISVKSGNKIQLIKFSDVTHFSAEDKYTFIHTLSGGKYIENRSLRQLLPELPPGFMQIHRAILLNFDLIDDIKKGTKSRFNFRMKDHNGTRLQSGTTYGPSIKEKLGL